MNAVRLALRTLALGALVAGSIAGPATAATATLVVPMKALNDSGENGIATLTQEASGVKVVIALKNGTDVMQPAHIHIGTCGNINKAPEFALVSLGKGESTSTVAGVTIDQLLAGHYAINVHKSADDLGTYVSCGDIKPAA
jgi:Cu/Zn superoxide dismutase